MTYIYYTKEGRFETENYFSIPWGKLHSPDDNTPALNATTNGELKYLFEGKLHRLTGPAEIYLYPKQSWYWLNGNYYRNLNLWLKNHPNQDETFQALMKLRYA